MRNYSAMRMKNLIIVILSLIVLFVIWLFITEREKARRKDEIIDQLRSENATLKSAYLNLFIKYLVAKGNVSPNVIDELKRLKNEVDDLDTSVHVELASVIRHVNEGEGTKGVRDLAKIVENVLKEKALKDSSFKKTPMLHNLLEYARDCKWINNRQFENGMKLKEIRNKESHELDPKVGSIDVGMCIYSGIEIIYAIK